MPNRIDDAEATFQVWRDQKVDLPTNAKETVEICIKTRQAIESIGPQRYREVQAANPKAEGVFSLRCLADFMTLLLVGMMKLTLTDTAKHVSILQ